MTRELVKTRQRVPSKIDDRDFERRIIKAYKSIKSNPNPACFEFSGNQKGIARDNGSWIFEQPFCSSVHYLEEPLFSDPEASTWILPVSCFFGGYSFSPSLRDRLDQAAEVRIRHSTDWGVPLVSKLPPHWNSADRLRGAPSQTGSSANP